MQRDWTVACEGRWYQLDRQHEALSLVGRTVVVRRLRDQRVQLVYRGKQLKGRETKNPQQVIKRGHSLLSSKGDISIKF